MPGKQQIKKQREDAANKGKNCENQSLMVPVKSFGAPGKYLLSPLVTLTGIQHSLQQYTLLSVLYILIKSNCYQQSTSTL